MRAALSAPDGLAVDDLNHVQGAKPRAFSASDAPVGGLEVAHAQLDAAVHRVEGQGDEQLKKPYMA